MLEPFKTTITLPTPLCQESFSLINISQKEKNFKVFVPTIQGASVGYFYQEATRRSEHHVDVDND